GPMIWDNDQAHKVARTASARRPASVIAIRVTSIGRPRPTTSLFLIASPAAINSSMVSTFTRRAKSILMVQPSFFGVRRPSTYRRGGSLVAGSSDCSVENLRPISCPSPSNHPASETHLLILLFSGLITGEAMEWHAARLPLSESLVPGGTDE